MTEVPVVPVAGAVVTALTVLTEGTVAVVCDSAVNVVGIEVLSLKHTDENMLQRFNANKYYFQLLHSSHQKCLNFNIIVTNCRRDKANLRRGKWDKAKRF